MSSVNSKFQKFTNFVYSGDEYDEYSDEDEYNFNSLKKVFKWIRVGNRPHKATESEGSMMVWNLHIGYILSHFKLLLNMPLIFADYQKLAFLKEICCQYVLKLVLSLWNRFAQSNTITYSILFSYTCLGQATRELSASLIQISAIVDIFTVCYYRQMRKNKILVFHQTFCLLRHLHPPSLKYY